MFKSKKPYHESTDGTIYYLEEQSNLYVQKLHLCDVLVLEVVKNEKHTGYVVKDHNKDALTTNSLEQIGIFLDSLADIRRKQKYGY